ncbi:hypothetical protein DP116_22960 [Brasilonema bromeliae SPC951]|uniref:RING-type domain-containing protein n=1 Tax=Brasilonema bromeliae SPC951 TaxID=385972 RepID=A0ABX1PF88_9CYAN|nr:hypothetical protein [Brasilonema bromeliae SPC951]
MSDDFEGGVGGEGGDLNSLLLKLVVKNAVKAGKKALDSKCSQCWEMFNVGDTRCCSSRMCLNCIQKHITQERFLFLRSTYFSCPNCSEKLKLS